MVKRILDRSTTAQRIKLQSEGEEKLRPFIWLNAALRLPSIRTLSGLAGPVHVRILRYEALQSCRRSPSRMSPPGARVRAQSPVSRRNQIRSNLYAAAPGCCTADRKLHPLSRVDAATPRADHARDPAVAGHLAEAQRIHVGERHERGQTSVGQPQQVVTLKMPSECSAGDVLNRGHPVIGVNYLLSNLESHIGRARCVSVVACKPHRKARSVPGIHSLLHEGERKAAGGGRHAALFSSHAAFGAPDGAYAGGQLLH